MKRLIFFCVLLFLLGSLPSRPSQAVLIPHGWSPTDKVALTFYFYWYDKPSNRHFIDPDGSDALTDHPPDAYLVPPPTYSYNDAGWHKRELEDIMQAGIDAVLPIYWGDTGNANVWAKPGLQKLVEAENMMISEGKNPPKIGMFNDTTALNVQYNMPDISAATGHPQYFYGMIYDFFSIVPQNLWATIDGRPILYLYGSNWVSKYDQGTFTYVYDHFQADFGTKPWIIKETSWQGVTTEGEYTWGAAAFGANIHSTVGNLGPGYDDSAVYGRDPHTYRDRQCGEFYETSWEAIIASGAKLVTIETWNEFHEGTDVAPSREYGRAYLEQTAANIQRWKNAGSLPGQMVWIDLGMYPYAQGMQVTMNFGDGVWKTHQVGGREAAYPDLSSQPTSYHIYLSIADSFWHATPGEAWVTVEYFDGGTDSWFLEYDAVGDGVPIYYKDSPLVQLTDSQQWKRQTFHFTDAYFAGRQNGGADLRLVTYDGIANDFGRVWVSKTNPTNPAPNLLGPFTIVATPGETTVVPFSYADPDGGSVTVSLDKGAPFASLADRGGGQVELNLSPTQQHIQPCPYRLRLLASDNDSPTLSDAVTVLVFLPNSQVFLPWVRK